MAGEFGSLFVLGVTRLARQALGWFRGIRTSPCFAGIQALGTAFDLIVTRSRYHPESLRRRQIAAEIVFVLLDVPFKRQRLGAHT